MKLALLLFVLFQTHQAHQPRPAETAAPLLEGLGDWHLPVSTTHARAQRFFDQGLRLYYGFNFEESLRAFQEAARLDPDLAMAYWGQAMALGPNLNAPMSPEEGTRAYAAARQAASLAAKASAKEQALIAALQTRFAADGAGDRAALDAAFANASASVAKQYPNDPDVVTFAAAAFMQTIAWDYFLADGAPKPGVEEQLAALERIVKAQPTHAGAHHFLIHLVEASDRFVERAVPSADRLVTLMPSAGHMVHMPSHIYLRVGRYADAVTVNELASRADEDYIAQCRMQGVYPVAYYPHNLHFLWAAATIEGRGELAIASARKVADKVPHHLAGKLAWTHEFPVITELALVRFGRWSDILSQPKPTPSSPFQDAMWHYARAIARAARGEVDKARSELASMEQLRKHESFAGALAGTALPSNFDIALEEVRAEIAFAAGDAAGAIAIAAKAVALQDAQPYSEPALWHRPVRLVLGQMLFEAGRFADAEAVYREELARLRENGWGLFGLWQSLLAQGKVKDASDVRARFEKAWSRADVALTSTRMMPVRRAVDSAEKTMTLATGVRLEYVEQGDRSGMPVVFLHGVTDSWRSFERLLPYLPQSVRAISVSLRGHGDSTQPPSGYSPVDMARDLRAFFDAAGIARAAIVGHSMGTIVAQQFAADHPDRVSSLVLIGAFASFPETPGMKEFNDATVAPLTDPISAAFAREWQVSTLARPIPSADLDMYVAETLKLPAHVWHQAFRGMLDTPGAAPRLAGTRVPLLLLWGERDGMAPREAQHTLARLVPGTKLTIYAGAGHALHWEDPARAAHDIAAFTLNAR